MKPVADSLRWLLVVALVLLAPACRKRPSVSPGKNLPGATALCGDYAVFVDGPYKYENNVWGQGKARGVWEQCLLERDVDGRTEYGWTWNWPGFDPSVFAYPEIIFGWKPWSGGVSTDSRLPRRVSDLRVLKMHYEVETQASGNYNLAPEVWLIERKAGNDPNPRLITAEIMFWMESAGGSRPAGEIVDRPELGGVRYELWKEPNAGDTSNSSSVKWALLSLKAPRTMRKGTLDLALLLQYLVKTGHVNSEHYVASIEFGNEITGGQGWTWVKRFEVEASP